MKQTLLIAVVVFGLVGGGGLAPAMEASSARTTDSVTAADSTHQTDRTDLPPGLSEEGVTDPLALVTAHQRTLRNTSYTLSTAFVFRWSNGTMFSHGTSTSLVAPGAESYYAITSQAKQNAVRPVGDDHYEFAVWANETEAAIARNVSDSETTYRLSSRSEAPINPNTQWELLYSAFASANTTVVGQLERNGTTLYKVVSTSSPEAVSTRSAPQYDFSALVDSRGVVHEFRLTQHTSFEGEPATVTRTVRVSHVGTTTVERPSWYEEAVENETT